VCGSSVELAELLGLLGLLRLLEAPSVTVTTRRR